jgi:hypothetical protein
MYAFGRYYLMLLKQKTEANQIKKVLGSKQWLIFVMLGYQDCFILLPVVLLFNNSRNGEV